MAEKLKPCPFCKSADHLRRSVHTNYTECVKCRAMGPNEDDKTGWNHRPIEDELVDALEMAMSEIDRMKPTEVLVAVSLFGRATLKRAKGEA